MESHNISPKEEIDDDKESVQQYLKRNGIDFDGEPSNGTCVNDLKVEEVDSFGEQDFGGKIELKNFEHPLENLKSEVEEMEVKDEGVFDAEIKIDVLSEEELKNEPNTNDDRLEEANQQCTSQSVQLVNLKSRIRSALFKEKEFTCEHCEHKSVNAENLNEHIRTVHTTGTTKCVPYDEQTKVQLDHSKSEGGNVNFKAVQLKCEHCDHRTYCLDSLNRHVRSVHFKDEPFKCEQCDYKSAIREHLNRHVRNIHRKHEHFKCEQCEYESDIRGSLNRHVKRVHLKVKKFQCKHCDYSGTRLDDLKDHVKIIHKNDKQIKCEYCEYKVIWPGNMKRHVKSVHLKNKGFKCEHCEYKAVRLDVLENHVRKVHSHRNDLNVNSSQLDEGTRKEFQ